MSGLPDDGRGGPTVLVLQHEDGCPPDRLGDGLQLARVRLDVRRPYAGDDVPRRVDADGLVVLGGHMGAGDDADAPWLPATRTLLRSAVRGEVPVLGVCLGGQLLAAACGGRVQVGRHGLEAGVLELEWLPAAADDPLFAGRACAAPSMHRDEIAELPPGAVWLARSRTYPHQAFRLGPSAWGLQFHPEVSLPTYRRWAERAEADGAAAGSAARLVAGLAARDAEVGAGALALAARLAELLPGGDGARRPAAWTAGGAAAGAAAGVAGGAQVTRR